MTRPIPSLPPFDPQVWTRHPARADTPWPAYLPEPVQPPRPGPVVTAFGVGLAGVVFTLVPATAAVGVLLGGLGVVLGWTAWSRGGPAALRRAAAGAVLLAALVMIAGVAGIAVAHAWAPLRTPAVSGPAGATSV